VVDLLGCGIMYLSKAQVRVLRIVGTVGVAVAADFAGLPVRWRETAHSLVRHGFLKSVGSGFMLTERGAAQGYRRVVGCSASTSIPASDASRC
jgi:hypothetical protein